MQNFQNTFTSTAPCFAPPPPNVRLCPHPKGHPTHTGRHFSHLQLNDIPLFQVCREQLPHLNSFPLQPTPQIPPAPPEPPAFNTRIRVLHFITLPLKAQLRFPLSHEPPPDFRLSSPPSIPPTPALRRPPPNARPLPR